MEACFYQDFCEIHVIIHLKSTRLELLFTDSSLYLVLPQSTKTLILPTCVYTEPKKALVIKKDGRTSVLVLDAAIESYVWAYTELCTAAKAMLVFHYCVLNYHNQQLKTIPIH